jgi:protein-S-isoprenylcysteine O-methyltransferase Ste14
MPKLKFYIDTHKGITLLVMLLLLIFFQRWNNSTAWLYLAMHGLYGLLWVLKSRVFPDKRWEQSCSLFYGIFAVWGGLSLYWIAGFMIMYFNISTAPWYQGLCVFLFGLGLFFHFASDMQKHTELRLRPGTLIQDGFFKHTRNPNYFGEFLIYLGFGMLAYHWLPVVILLTWVIAYWLPSMIKKDRSLAKYREFKQYKKTSRLFIPFLF